MTLTALKNDKGLKRICGSCTTKFYDFNKSPITCPKCGEEFTGAAKIKSRRTRTKAADDEKVKPIEERAKAVDTDQSADEEDTISLEELEAKTTGKDGDDDEEEDLAGDLDLDELANIDDSDDDDDFEDGDDLDLTRVTSDS